MVGEYKYLYESDKVAFKNKFGDFINKEERDNPFKYLTAMMRHAALSRKQMPCIVFDNTDHHGQEFQEAVFQFAQMINSKTVSFIIIPITDRTIWRLSKSGVFQSFVSKTFYLPVPSTKEVLSRRISYVRAKTISSDKAKTYFSSRGIRLEIQNIEKFASLLEDIFINTEFVSRLIGWLGNQNLRRSFLIASQIITSPTLGIDKLVAAALSNSSTNIRRFDIMRAVLFGKYQHFNSPDNEYVFNVFDLPPFVTSSPLLIVRILSMLQGIFLAAGEDLEQKYIAASDVAAFFEPMGIDNRHVIWAIEKMVERRLVEPYNPSQDTFNDGTRIAITQPGRIHLEFAENEAVYLEQTALVTGLRVNQIGQSIKSVHESKSLDHRTKWFQIRKIFTDYLLSEDLIKTKVPNSALYVLQKSLNEQLGHRWTAIGS